MSRVLKFKYVLKDGEQTIVSRAYIWSEDEGLPCLDKLIEDINEDYGCDGSCTNESVAHCECNPIFENASVVAQLQFTGLFDENGKEIYDGDIVVKNCYMWFDEGKSNYRGTVEWIFSQWQVVAHCVNKDRRGISDGVNIGLNDDGREEGERTDWMIIGNIYDNPELLGAKIKG